MASNTTQVVTAPASKPPPPPGQGPPPRLPPNSGTPAPADVEEVGKEPWPDPSCRSTPYESRSTWFSDLQAIAYATGERHPRLLWGL